MAQVSGKLKWYSYVPRQIVKLGEEGLLQAALDIYNKAQQIVPKDDGELTLGARVSSEKIGHVFTAVVSYGNNSVSKDYAVIQHYNLQYNHKAGESALYLQTPFLQSKPLKSVSDRIRDLL